MAYGLDVDRDGNAYVVGETSSDATSFPVVAGPDLTYNGGICDAFIAPVDRSGEELDFCGYIEGTEEDRGCALGLDPRGYAYITGTTASNNSSFHTRIGPEVYHSGEFDAFVAQIPPYHILLRAGNTYPPQGSVTSTGIGDILLVNASVGSDVFRRVLTPDGHPIPKEKPSSFQISLE